jgi:CubicO group peptidase (beta-lactamase class C family)
MLNPLEQRIMSRYNNVSALSRFSGCILVAKDSNILTNVNLGFADYVQETHFTSDSTFSIASLSKMFTAGCILLLKEQGKLKLTDSIGEYSSDYKKGAHVSVKQLLGHISGVPEHTSKGEFWDLANKIQSPNDIYEFIKEMDMEWEAGSRYGYCNSNYILLGLIIEKLSEKSYGDFLDEHIFKPLNMTHSGIPREADISKMAVGYDTLCPQPVAAEKLRPVIPFAAGAIHSNANDLFKWSSGLFNGKLLTRESLQEMVTVDRGDYGLGIGIGKSEIGGKNYTVAGHGGFIPGFHSKFTRILETRHTFILLCNVADVPIDECFSEVMNCVNAET